MPLVSGALGSLGSFLHLISLRIWGRSGQDVPHLGRVGFARGAGPAVPQHEPPAWPPPLLSPCCGRTRAGGLWKDRWQLVEHEALGTAFVVR